MVTFMQLELFYYNIFVYKIFLMNIYLPAILYETHIKVYKMHQSGGVRVKELNYG